MRLLLIALLLLSVTSRANEVNFSGEWKGKGTALWSEACHSDLQQVNEIGEVSILHIPEENIFSISDCWRFQRPDDSYSSFRLCISTDLIIKNANELWFEQPENAVSIKVATIAGNKILTVPGNSFSVVAEIELNNDGTLSFYREGIDGACSYSRSSPLMTRK